MDEQTTQLIAGMIQTDRSRRALPADRALVAALLAASAGYYELGL